MTTSVTVVQLASRGPESHSERVGSVMRLVRGLRADCIVLPELWPSGGFEYERFAADAEPLDGPTAGAIVSAARTTGAWIVGGSFVERSDSGALYNTSTVVSPDGEIVATYRKTHLFGIGSREPDVLTPGGELTVIELPWARMGLSICYDLRFPELYRALIERDAEVLVVPAAWPSVRRAAWELLLQARAVENQAFVLGCNAVGHDGGLVMGGASMIVHPSGEILARAGDEGQEVIAAALDLESLRALRSSFPTLTHRRLRIDEHVLTS